MHIDTKRGRSANLVEGTHRTAQRRQRVRDQQQASSRSTTPPVARSERRTESAQYCMTGAGLLLCPPFLASRPKRSLAYSRITRCCAVRRRRRHSRRRTSTNIAPLTYPLKGEHIYSSGFDQLLAKKRSIFLSFEECIDTCRSHQNVGRYSHFHQRLREAGRTLTPIRSSILPLWSPRRQSTHIRTGLLR